MKAFTKSAAIRLLKKQHSRPATVKRLDRAFSRWIIRKHGAVCYTCGTTLAGGAIIQCGHLISRVNYSTRWAEENARPQCRGCNFSHEHHPETYTTKYISEVGLKAYEKLVFLSKQPCKISTPELMVLVRYYEDECK